MNSVLATGAGHCVKAEDHVLSFDKNKTKY